jgi:hypothetical protein
MPPRNAPLLGDTAQTVAWVALVVALTAPLWENTVLWSLGIHTPPVRMAEQATAALARQDTKLAVVEQRLVVTAAQLDTMRTGLAAATQRATEASAQVQTLAMLRLADALRGSSPFATELTILRGAGGGGSAGLKAALAQLDPYAAIGVPTLGQLQRDLQELHYNMVQAARPAAQSSWMGLINWTGLGGVPDATPTDPGIGAAWSGLRRLATADLSGAIEQASQVGGMYQSSFADWVADAKARLAANQAVQQIDLLIKRPLGPTAAR